MLSHSYQPRQYSDQMIYLVSIYKYERDHCKAFILPRMSSCDTSWHSCLVTFDGPNSNLWDWSTPDFRWVWTRRVSPLASFTASSCPFDGGIDSKYFLPVISFKLCLDTFTRKYCYDWCSSLTKHLHHCAIEKFSSEAEPSQKNIKWSNIKIKKNEQKIGQITKLSVNFSTPRALYQLKIAHLWKFTVFWNNVNSNRNNNNQFFENWILDAFKGDLFLFPSRFKWIQSNSLNFISKLKVVGIHSSKAAWCDAYFLIFSFLPHLCWRIS